MKKIKPTRGLDKILRIDGQATLIKDPEIQIQVNLPSVTHHNTLPCLFQG